DGGPAARAALRAAEKERVRTAPADASARVAAGAAERERTQAELRAASASAVDARVQELARKGRDGVPGLMEMARGDGDPRVRAQAVRALARIDDPAVDAFLAGLGARR
ncbi:MAG: hypothetical protein JWM27_1476, partial [Gemmatimonadetes bacterium]|nr:hypothetical protein [Gemmatimonadota bacterium]